MTPVICSIVFYCFSFTSLVSSLLFSLPPFLSVHQSTHNVLPIRFAALSHLAEVNCRLFTASVTNNLTCNRCKVHHKSASRFTNSNFTSLPFLNTHSQTHTCTNNTPAPLQLHNNCSGILANGLCLLSLLMGYVIVYFH